jgi:hypothetical protein
MKTAVHIYYEKMIKRNYNLRAEETSVHDTLHLAKQLDADGQNC